MEQIGNAVLKKLDDFVFVGRWESSSIYDVPLLFRIFKRKIFQTPFNYFENSDGKVLFRFQFQDQVMNLTIEFLDGYYFDKKRTEIFLTLSEPKFPQYNFISINISKKKSIWNEENKNMNYSKINNYALDQQIGMKRRRII